ncbi:hypothetical protein ACFXKC_17965 [Streptomyces sp. NPDC059340]|uniref:hypothetical protein n=1 Tax=Streptomyces sp. NPDC059340 TaxID=3346806 RepID=UPI00369A83E8
MGWFLDRRMQAANPYASNPSTKDRDKAARKAAKQGRRSGSARSVRSAAAREGQAWEDADRQQDRKGPWYRPR